MQETCRAGRDGLSSSQPSRYVDEPMNEYVIDKDKCRQHILLKISDRTADFNFNC